MHPNHWLLAGLAILATFLVFALTQAQAPQPQVAPCLLAWDTMTEAEQEACIESAGGPAIFNATTDALTYQTLEAAPTPDRTALLATVEAEYEQSGKPAVAPTITPGIHPELQQIRRIEPQEVAGGPNSIRYKYSASVWVAGAVVDAQGYGQQLYVTTPRRACRIRMVVPHYTPGVEQYHRSWACPQEIGEIIITNITAQGGILSFTTELSQTGTFNLATEEWTLAGAPWLP